MGRVHWHEGLFLQPHHLQMMQRDAAERVWSGRRLGMPYPYGVVELALAPETLENRIVRFDRLRAVMPSGLEVDVPGNAELNTLDFKVQYSRIDDAGLSVGLAVPLWQGQRANTLEAAASGYVKRAYTTREERIADENTGEGAIDVRVRRINARLVLPGDNTDDMEVMPIMRIVRGSAETGGRPRQDDGFIPPALSLGGSTRLRDLVRGLTSELEGTRRDLAFQMKRAGFTVETARGGQLEELLRLRSLNVFAARLSALCGAGGPLSLGVTPFEVYMELRHLLSELASLQAATDPWDAPRYDHDHLAGSFLGLVEGIRRLLRGTGRAGHMVSVFTRDEGGVLRAVLTPENLKDAAEYFLGVRSKDEGTVVAKLVESKDKFKLMPRSMIDKGVWGVVLQEERNPPAGLPMETGLYYFRFNKAQTSKMIWSTMEGERALAARWPADEGQGIDTEKMAIYMPTRG